MAINDLEKMDNYNPTNYVNNSEPDIDAEHLNKTENKLEETVEKANEIIDTLKALISTVQTNSQTTVPSSSLVYSMQQAITKNTDDIATANSNLESIPLIKYGTVICRYRDAGYLQATIDVSDFKSYKIFLSFDSDTDGFINNEPYPFNVNNTVYIRSGKVNFVSGSSLSIAYLIVGIKK